MVDEQFEIDIILNHKRERFAVSKTETLAEVLREQAGLQWPIDHGLSQKSCRSLKCSSFPVQLNGNVINANFVFAKDANNFEIQTFDEFMKTAFAQHLTELLLESDAYRYGCCIQGIEALICLLLKQNPAPTIENVRQILSGNLCTCAGKQKIEKAAVAIHKIVCELADEGFGADSAANCR